MSQVVQYMTDDGTTVQFEIEPLPGFEPASYKEAAVKVGAAIEPAIKAAKVVLARAKSMSPDYLKVKFGVKVTGTANWLIARAASEGSFEITLFWGTPTGEDDD